jgi:hypothetical protein
MNTEREDMLVTLIVNSPIHRRVFNHHSDSPWILKSHIQSIFLKTVHNTWLGCSLTEELLDQILDLDYEYIHREVLNHW